MSESPLALARYEEFLLWLIERIEKFPRSQRHLLGARMENVAADILEALIAARYRREQREERLGDVNLGIETLRYYLRIVTRLRFLSSRQQEFAIESLADVGRQVGGWLKSLQP